MFQVTVHDEFAAAHALRIGGSVEPVHGHNWRVAVTIEGRALDADGLLVDFHAAEADLRAVVDPYRNANLNEAPPFDRVNPSAERVVEHIGRSMSARLRARGWTHVRVACVSVTEAPGCVAVYRPE